MKDICKNIRGPEDGPLCFPAPQIQHPIFHPKNLPFLEILRKKLVGTEEEDQVSDFPGNRRVQKCTFPEVTFPPSFSVIRPPSSTNFLRVIPREIPKSAENKTHSREFLAGINVRSGHIRPLTTITALKRDSFPSVHQFQPLFVPFLEQIEKVCG